MENMLYNISQVLGITIIHSLWQGLLIYFLLRVVLLVASGLTSSKKYLLAVSSLLAITGWFAYTLIHEIQVYDWMAKPSTLANMPLMLQLPANMRHFNDASIRYYYSIEKYLPYVTAVYVLGLMLNMARVVLAHRKIGIVKRTMSLGVQLQQQIGNFAQKMDITKTVRVGFSRMVDVPCIVGFLKPVILLPITLSTYLEAEEIEAILMHELAHIKRNDYIINLLQQVITTLLFFNPCVLLINKLIGEERENSCDDLVVDCTQAPVVYAKALFKLEQNRQNELQLALAVTGKKYQLLTRIERIMKTKKQMPSIRPTLVAMLILTIGVSSLALFNPEIAQGKISVKAITPEIIKGIITPDTIPAKRAVKATKTSVRVIAAKPKAEIAKARAQKGRSYYSNDYGYHVGLQDPQLEKLSQEVSKHGDAISKYYDSPEFKAKSEEMDRLGKEVSKHGDAISKYYDSPEFKAKSEEMDRLGKQVEAFYNSPGIKQAIADQEKAAKEYDRTWSGKSADMEKNGKQMEALGKQIETYFNTPEFKALNEKLQKKYGVNSRDYNDSRNENYKKYQAELDQNLSPEIKQTTAQMKKLGEQMRGISNDPDATKQRDAMRTAGENMRKAYNNPDIKAAQERMRKLGQEMRSYADNSDMKKEKTDITVVQEKMRKLGQEMRSYADNPDMKKEKEELRAASDRLRAYTRSPEFKKKVAEYRKSHPEEAWNWNNDNDNHNNNDNNNAEKAEVAEKN
jgi:bla regulator protein BlaR1